MRPYARLLLASCMVLAVACSSSSSTGPNGSGPISASINGSGWSGTVQARATRTVTGGDTIITIGGANTGEKIIMALAFNDVGTGVYGIGAINEPANAILNEGSSTWTANITGGSGSITVDTITATRVTGTFQYSAVPVSGSGASGTENVTNGKFALSF
jgi:hypothetical protein